MDLTGKCKEDFYNFITKGFKECDFARDMIINDLKFKSKTELNALIIEFFDSVGYHFNTGLSFLKKKPYKCELYILDNDGILGECYEFKGKFLSTKQSEATEQSIKKANEIYNNLFLPK